MKRFEYSPLGSELKKQTCITEKQYPGLNTFFECHTKEEPVTVKTEKLVITDKSKLMYGSKYSFSDFSNINKYYVLSFIAKYDKLVSFYHRLYKVRNLVPETKKQKSKNKKTKKKSVKKCCKSI